MDKYNPARDVSPEFLGRIAAWIEASGEVLVVLRYLRMSGRKDFALCRTRQDFELLVKSVPSGTDICVLRDRQLSIRGIVDDAFIEKALSLFSEGEEYLLITTATLSDSRISQGARLSDSQVDLLDDLYDEFGVEIALGPCPQFMVADHEGLVSAAKDGIDGPR